MRGKAVFLHHSFPGSVSDFSSSRSLNPSFSSGSLAMSCLGWKQQEQQFCRTHRVTDRTAAFPASLPTICSSYEERRAAGKASETSPGGQQHRDSAPPHSPPPHSPPLALPTAPHGPRAAARGRYSCLRARAARARSPARPRPPPACPCGTAGRPWRAPGTRRSRSRCRGGTA